MKILARYNEMQVCLALLSDACVDVEDFSEDEVTEARTELVENALAIVSPNTAIQLMKKAYAGSETNKVRETALVREVYEMGIESLSPENFEALNKVIDQLTQSRHLEVFRKEEEKDDAG
jgi:hypothetical protein